MGTIDERAKIVGRTVQMRRRVEIDAVVAPAEAPLELGDRHHFDHRDAEPGEFLQFTCGRRPRPFAGERAHVHFVNNLAGKRDTAPLAVGP